jgi:phage tail-like protein
VARSNRLDFLQDNAFWLMDVAPIEPLSIPVFSPLAGFSAISAPEITLEVGEIQEANSLYRKKVVKKGEVGSLTLSRGATFDDGDFYRWTMAALLGNTGSFSLTSAVAAFDAVGGVGGPTPRRDLLLVHYFKRTPLGAGTTEAFGAALNAALVGAAALDAGGVNAGVAQAVAAIGIAVSPLGPFEIYPKIPARAWLLKGCLPTRYKAGTDFDATSGQVSIMELDVAPESIEEISLSE